MEHFIIDQVQWHTEVEGDREPTEKIHRRFRSVIMFLQKHQLTKRIILKEKEEITNEFAISTEDLTETGFELMKLCYSKWLKQVDKGLSPEDITLFEKALLKLNKP
ncbi:MAG: hypothetical protein MUE81_21400 [Thermoflexibacter sp.]|jgi:hypothetical protein|nr:hypothetical protein [Thermoflexibacter sp.]